MDFALIWAAAFLIPLCAGQEATDGAVPFEVSIVRNQGTVQVIEGQGVKFDCQATSTTGEAPKLKWFIADREVTTYDKLANEYLQQRGAHLRLYITKVGDDQRGAIKCVGALNDQEASDVLELQIIPKLVIKAPKEQLGQLGQEGNLSCKTNLPSYKTWMFGNTTDIVAGPKYVFTQDTLKIKELTFADSGMYICRIEQDSSFDFTDYRIEFNVFESPTIAEPPMIQPNHPKQGDDVKITCTAQGTPKPTYTFQRGENELGSDTEQVDGLNGVLTLKSVNLDSEGKYTCKATNVGGSDEKTATLDIKIPPTIEDLGVIEDANEEESRTIDCVARGDPPPSVEWFKDGIIISGSESGEGPTVTLQKSQEPETAKIKSQSASLVFGSVRPSDAGKYMCKAWNTAGATNVTIDFEVKYKPHFDTYFKEKVFYGWPGHTANLTCVASANDLANFRWFIPDADEPMSVAKGKQINTEAPYTVSTVQKFEEQHLSSSSLLVSILPGPTDVYRDYLCEADNGQTEVQIVTLKEATAPGKPTLRKKELYSMSAILEVVLPTVNGGQPVNRFTYSYQEGADPATKVDGEIKEKDIQGDTTVFTLKNLKPATSYLVEIKAGNRVGLGPLDSFTFETMKVSVPERLDITSPQQGIQPTSYTLQWGEPQNGGSEITKFIITYQKAKVDTSQPSTEWTIIEYLDDKPTELKLENDPGATQYTIRGLQSNSYYDVRITAENEKGESVPERRIIKTSAKGADSSTAAAAGLSSAIVIAIIIAIIGLLFLVILIIYVVSKKRPQLAERIRGKKGGDAEGAAKEDGKDQAEEEKLIKKDDTVQVENETGDTGEVTVVPISQPEEYEPDTKPEVTETADPEPPAAAETPAPEPAPTEAPAPTPAPEKPAEPAVEPTPAPEVTVTPETTDKSDAPTA